PPPTPIFPFPYTTLFRSNKLRFLPLAPETVQLLEHYMRLERPNPCSAALFVSLKGPARGQRMTPAGLRSLFRYHRRTTGIADQRSEEHTSELQSLAYLVC